MLAVSATRTDVLTMRTRSTAAWLLLLVLGSSTAPKSTRNEGMPPWGGKFVGRLERQIGRLGLQPGVFFDEWRTALTDYGWYRITLIDLKAENDRTTMTESLRALSRGQKAIEWQRAQVERLKASAWARSREVSDWTAQEMVSLLSACNVVDQQDEFILPRLYSGRSARREACGFFLTKQFGGIFSNPSKMICAPSLRLLPT